MKKVVMLVLAATIIALGTVSSFALDPIVSPVAPVYSDTDTEPKSPYAPKTGNTAAEAAFLCAGVGALAFAGISVGKRINK